MKNIKSKITHGLLAIVMVSSLSSCMTTKTSVGMYQETQGVEYTYAKGKQFWLLWGILPLGRTNVKTPADGNSEVITRFTLGDAIISTVTFGLVTSYTIKVKVKEQRPTASW